MEIRIDAVITNGIIDTLSYYSDDSEFGRITGSIDKEGTGIWFQGIGQIMYSQFFYNEVFLGAFTQDVTTGDTSKSMESIGAMKNLVDEVGYATNFSIDDTHYHFIPVKNNSIRKSGTDIFSATFKYLHERALFFIYDYHFSMWHIDLTRGEAMFEYIVCHLLQPDEEKNKAERNRKIQEQVQEERRQKELKQEQDLFATKFYQTEYGKAIQYLNKYLDLPDDVFEEEINRYLASQLSRFHIKSTTVGSLTANGTKLINGTYAEEHPYLVREFRQKYTVSIPSGLENSYILVVPTKIGLKDQNLCVYQAVIYYLNVDDKRLRLYLDNFQDEIKLGESNAGTICQSSSFSIGKSGNNYVAKYSGKEYGITPVDLSRKNKKECFYLIWDNDDTDMITNVLSKNEVSRPIENRFRSQ